VRPLCRQKGLGLLHAAPLHMRVLSDEGPPDWHPAPSAVKEAGRKVVELCKRAGADVADVALRFCLDHPYVSTTVIGMFREAEVERNLRALEMRNDPALLAEIEKVVAPVKKGMWRQGRPENDD